MTLDYSTLGPTSGSRLVIAGGSGGIGRELVRACKALQHEVVVLDLEASIADNAREEGVEYIAFDGASSASITDATQQLTAGGKHLDGFVFLSGFPLMPRRPLSEVAVEQWDELMAVNLRSAYLLSAGLLPLLKRADAPAIVTVASSLGYQVMPGMGAYATSKGGLVSLTKALAMENAPKVRANVVAPGAVETNFLAGGTGRDASASDRSWFDQMSDKYVASIPLGRVAEPSDIVGPILFLLGPNSSYMTGQVLHLNGGRFTP
ncbi:SDR family NAD(P)-dependent oxidoreductase [Sphingobium boeckii]|uniref:NAD(P)-dependent dehydrogenase (Short-subunit alcohol dehydrogenase family) n=1 Tax=Sphingobium boeckii TaxID=1082345 RepID=A0A7W9EG36_9SPHN|nr:SDR family oxidoreductase [Sphingobium boeckii]MBB5686346.1 NAD(P)-dependent dehydrogenase (short-subunit alcohol dehydrogenase family) [Sphingobium boeckii]